MNDLQRKAAEVQLGVLKLQHKLLESRLKGDLTGHPFRGNQWSGGQGGQMAPDVDMGSGVASESGSSSPKSASIGETLGGKPIYEESEAIGHQVGNGFSVTAGGRHLSGYSTTVSNGQVEVEVSKVKPITRGASTQHYISENGVEIKKFSERGPGQIKPKIQKFLQKKYGFDYDKFPIYAKTQDGKNGVVLP